MDCLGDPCRIRVPSTQIFPSRVKVRVTPASTSTAVCGRQRSSGFRHRFSDFLNSVLSGGHGSHPTYVFRSTSQMPRRALSAGGHQSTNQRTPSFSSGVCDFPSRLKRCPLRPCLPSLLCPQVIFDDYGDEDASTDSMEQLQGLPCTEEVRCQSIFLFQLTIFVFFT